MVKKKKKKKTSKEVLGVFFLLSCYFSFLEIIKYGNTFLQKVWTNLTSSGLVHAHIKFVCRNDIMIAFFSIDPSLLELRETWMEDCTYLSHKRREL
jgi:uncharacterized membrane protein (DUF485 family)